jgi:hypothetical protein
MGNIVIAQGGIPIQQGIYEESITKKAELGRLLPFLDGRCFRYCYKATGAGITQGHMAAAAAFNADTNQKTQTGMTVAISGASIGAKVIKVLLEASVAANLFEDGLLTIEDSTGAGYCYRIKSNKVGGASVAAPCELTLYDPIVVALSATTILSLTVNKWKNVVVAPVAEKSTLVGVPLIAITAEYYFWAQTRGYAAVMADTADSPIAGEVAGLGVTTPGSCKGAEGTIYQPWGVCIQPEAEANSKYATIDLQLE